MSLLSPSIVPQNHAEYPKSEQDKNNNYYYCLIIQHTDNKAQCTEFISGKMEKLPFFSPPDKITFITGYLSSACNEYSVQYHHIATKY